MPPSNLSFWQRAELFHRRSLLLNTAVKHYALYAELYSKQGNWLKFHECRARVEEIKALAVTHRLLELHEWRLAYHYEMSSQQSQWRLKRAFSLMAKAYLVSFIVWTLYAAIH